MACISLPTAMLVGTAVSGIGSIASSVIGANAAKESAAQQVAATNKAIASSTGTFAQNKALLQPFITAGTNVGVAGMEDLLGKGNLDMDAVMKALEKTPGYQFSLQQGLKGVQNSYAAKGLGSSGAALRGGADYAEGLAGTTYQNIFGNFKDLADLGVTAGSSLAGVSTNLQSSINNLITGGGSAQAAGTVGAANALTGGIGSLTDSISNGALLLGLQGAGFFNTGGANAGASGGNSLIPQNWSATRGFY